MRAQVLIGFLLTCAVAAHPVADDIEGANVVESEPTEFFMTDDHGDFRPIDMEEDDAETEEETRKDLGNRVFFYLHTRDHRSEHQLIIDNDESLSRSQFDPNKPTMIVTHGWINSRYSPVCTLIRDAYLKHGDYNMIVIDWSSISFRPYVWASRRVKMVGEFVSAMLNFLLRNGLNPDETTLVGHSLGAHVVGLAARNSDTTIQYVVGLDPALPGFNLAGPGERIASGDAKHVEVIHTNAGILGYLSAIGDVDFYPNGGSKQAGCLVDAGGACSHARSYRFFAESINTPVGFHGKKCKSYLQFQMGRCKTTGSWVMGGYKTNHFAAQGTYFLETNALSPFAKGHRK